MIAVIGGLATAVIWAAATLVSARASRRIGPWSTTAWVALVGLFGSIPIVLAGPFPGPGDEQDLLWVAFIGLGYLGGMVLNYAALARGKVAMVAAITSTEGAIAAVIAVVGGEPATPLLLALLGMVVAGIVATTLEPGVTAESFFSGDRRFLLFACGAALLFGTSLYAAGRASDVIPLGWVVIAGRIAGVLFVALPLILTRRLRIERAVVPFVIAAGLLEVAGYLTFALGARDGIAVTAVLASQFAVMAAVGAHLLGERLAPRQWAGVGVVAVGVAAVTLLRV